MIRQPINIGHLQYVIDYYDAYFDDFIHYENFVMIRNYDIMNDVIDDNDLYFIDTNVFNDKDNKIIWPINDDNGGGFTYDKYLYNQYIDDYTLNNNYDVFNIYNRNKQIAKIRCNKVRVYAPSIKRNTDAIIHIDNFINNIHVHYLCKKYKDCEIGASEEFVINNYVYSEYIEFYFPNIYDLFGNDKGHEHSVKYFVETLNFYNISNIKNELLLINDEDDISGETVISPSNSSQLPDSTIFFNVNDGKQHEPQEYETVISSFLAPKYLPLNIFSMPYKIEYDKTINEYVKKYVTSVKSIENNYLTYPVNITIYPYEKTLLNDKFILDEQYGKSSVTLMSDLKITLSSKMGFNDNKVSIITKFVFPDFIKFESDENGSSVKKAYEFYNNVYADNYDEYSDYLKETKLDKYFKELEKTELTETDLYFTRSYYKRNYTGFDENTITNKNLKDYWLDMKKKTMIEEIEENIDSKIDFLGFRVLIASDKDFKNIVFDNSVKISFNDLDDFAFHLNNIFDSWDEVHKGLYVAKVIFIDRFLGTQIISNTVLLTNEWIKYMIDSFDYRITAFDNKDIDNFDINYIYDDNMDYCFIDNIKCVVEKTNDNTDIVDVKSSNEPRLLYKPIFYKTNELQNLRIRKNIKQKVGINLAEFMTKVETFKLLLNGNEYVESGRNDVYVIFNIKGDGFTTSNGIYDIIDQDDEYISSGNYSIY